MSLIQKVKSTIEAPKDAVILSRSAAANMIWESASNLGYSVSWPLKASCGIGSFMCGVTSLYIVSNIRKKFKLGKYGYFTMAIPTLYIPMIGNFLVYKTFIAPPLLLQENTCPVCIEMRALNLQLGTAVLYPLVVGYFTSYATASGLGTIPAPGLKLLRYPEARKEMFEILKRTVKPMGIPLLGLTIANTVAATAAIFLMAYSIDGILKEIDDDRENKYQKLKRMEEERRIEAEKKEFATFTNIKNVF